jgi:tetratricopeptide (TPR) repeat protein
VPLLRSYAEKHKEYVWPVARLLEEIEQFDSAEEMYRQYVAQQRAKKPEADLTLAEYLGRRGRLSDALALCEAAWQTCPPELVAASSVTLLWSARPTPAQCQQVSGWLETALGRNAKAPVLVECLAAVRKLQGRHGDAIALYQQLLQERKLDPLTLNNLAWLQVFSGEAQRGPALQTIQRAIDLAGPVAELLDTRAVVYLQSGQAEQAVKDLNEALAEKPTGQRYFHLAQAHMALNNRREAQAALQQAHQLRLTADDVDPLERSSYQRVCAELERKK